MPRIVAALAIAAALVIGVFILKNKYSASVNSTALIAEQIQSANQPAIETYAKQLEALGEATDTSIIIPPTTTTPVAVTLGPVSATDKLSQNIFEQYINLKQSGVSISSDIATQVADNVLSQGYSGSDAPKTYSIKNFSVETANTLTEMKNYSLALASAISTREAPSEIYELQVFEDFANSNDASILSSLSLNIARYQKIISKLVATPVPQTLASNHITLVNSLSEMVFDIQKMQNFPADPIGGMGAVSDYDTASKNMAAALANQISSLSKDNIMFSSGK